MAAKKTKEAEGPPPLRLAHSHAGLLKNILPTMDWLKGQARGAALLCHAVGLVEGPLAPVPDEEPDDWDDLVIEADETDREAVKACLKHFVDAAALKPHAEMPPLLDQVFGPGPGRGEGKETVLRTASAGLLLHHLEALYVSTRQHWYGKEGDKLAALRRSSDIVAQLEERAVPRMPVPQEGDTQDSYDQRVREYLRNETPVRPVLVREEVNIAAAALKQALDLGTLHVCPASMELIKTLEVE
jgi:hypothetical protein